MSGEGWRVPLGCSAPGRDLGSSGEWDGDCCGSLTHLAGAGTLLVSPCTPWHDVMVLLSVSPWAGAGR